MAAAPCVTTGAADTSPAAACRTPLRSEHRRELFKLTAAALVTSTLALAPIAHDQRRTGESLASSSVTTGLHTLPDLRDATSSFALARSVQTPVRRPTPGRVTAPLPPLDGTSRAMSASLVVSPVVAEADVPAMEDPGPRFGALRRALVGDGRYSVRPFPAPGS
jgi:hypothetical protein